MSLSPRLLNAARLALTHPHGCVLVSVIEVTGSTPRGVGTTMLVLSDSIVDTIGGGRLEFEAIHAARKMLGTTESVADQPTRKRYPLGDSLGQCCGGTVTLLFDRLHRESVEWIDEALDCLQRRKIFERAAAKDVTYVAGPPRAHLLLFGAGHVGRALVSVLADAPISIHWVDERESEFPPCIPANVLVEVTDLPEVILKNAPAQSAVLITTHRHDLDFILAQIALECDEFAYIGLIGSASKRKRFERQWQMRAKPDGMLQKLVCPIGQAGPPGKEPAVVAIAVAGEILTIFS